MILIIYYLLFIPFHLAFENHINDETFTVVTVFIVFVDIIFSLNTAYYENGI